MAWDFETEPEFQRELDWMDAFVRDEIEPLDLVLGNPYDVNDKRAREIVEPLKQRVREELRKTGIALHLSIRTECASGLPIIELVHDPARALESDFVENWATSLRNAGPEVSVSARSNPNDGLSRALREEFQTGFGSVSLIVAQSCFLEGKPLRWDHLKALLLNSLPHR